MEYKLRTIKDIFDKVPADRIEVCMKELTILLTTAKNTAELIGAVIEDTSGQAVGQMYSMPEEITWVDDGKGEIQSNLPLGNQKLSVQVRRGEGKSGFDAVCDHCNQPFIASHKDGTLCGDCFIEGHRSFKCGQQCKPTETGRMQALQLRRQADALEAYANLKQHDSQDVE